jgi:hypothetical protein
MSTAVARLVRAELKLMTRDPLVLTFVFAFPIVTMLIIGGAFGTAPDLAFDGVNPSHWYVASYLTVVIAAIGLVMLPVHLAAYRERGVLRRFAVAGFPRWSFAVAEAERLGRETLAEVRMAVGMLRQPDDSGRTTPLPGVDGLPALVNRFRSAGADVTLTVDGDTGRLPATTGLGVYRILQEALTNAAKHAPGAPTTVRLAVAADAVRLAVDSAAEPGTGSGLGLLSMRERAESLGGRCQAGPGGQGWLVQATLPLDAASRWREGAS